MLAPLRISGPGGFICSIQPSSDTKLEHVQAAVMRETGVHPRGQRFYHGFTEMQFGGDLTGLCPDPGHDHVDLLLVRRCTHVSAEDRLAYLQEIEHLRAHEVDDWLSGKVIDALYDREIILALVAISGHALSRVPPDVQLDREFFLAAVRANGFALEHVSSEWRADRQVVLAAVEQNGLALIYAAQELRADGQVALAAVRQSAHALRYVAPALRKTPELLQAADPPLLHMLSCRPIGWDVATEILVSADVNPKSWMGGGAFGKLLLYTRDYYECLGGVATQAAHLFL